MLPSIEDRGQTDRVAVNATDCSSLLTITLNLIFKFQSHVSYGYGPYTWRKIYVNREKSVGSND